MHWKQKKKSKVYWHCTACKKTVAVLIRQNKTLKDEKTSLKENNKKLRLEKKTLKSEIKQLRNERINIIQELKNKNKIKEIIKKLDTMRQHATWNKQKKVKMMKKKVLEKIEVEN